MPASPSQPRHSQPPPAQYSTEPNDLGLFRIYPTQPTLIPDAESGLAAAVDAPTLEQHIRLASTQVGSLVPSSSTNITPDNLYSAFSSSTAGLLMCWHYSGTTAKSIPELNRLGSYTRDPLFNAAEELPFSHERERKLIEKYLRDQSNPFQAESGWSRSSVEIPLPKEKVKYTSEDDPSIPMMTVNNVVHRSIINIIKSVFEDDISSTFHMTPFEQFWETTDKRILKVYSEAYSSPVILDAYKEITALPRAPGDNYERVVASLMLWSDATQLANFGDASLWPIYLFFGNQSKYTHSKPTAAACHHVAYIPTVCTLRLQITFVRLINICIKLPDDFQDIYHYKYGEAATAETYTHCKRELVHAIWKLLLSEEFVEAYRNGIVIRCADGITRCIFPCFFTYSADYPEK